MRFYFYLRLLKISFSFCCSSRREENSSLLLPKRGGGGGSPVGLRYHSSGDGPFQSRVGLELSFPMRSPLTLCDHGLITNSNGEIPDCPLVFSCNRSGDSLVGQLVKNLPTMQETAVRFLGRKDPLEKG